MQAKSKILVVDDNAENRALAQATLDDDGYEVLLAATGEQGIAAFEAERPDCVLLDVRMPGMDGFAVCAKIRSLPGGTDTPIVFLTALRDVDTFDRALVAGGDDFLTKPVRPTELIARVQSALKLRRMNAELREHYDLVRHQRDALMRLQLQKERLTAFVVHDLKNPVSLMDLHAQVLASDRELTARARDSVAHIRDGARSLLRLILNLLDISKSEEGQLVARRGDVDLDALSLEVLEAQQLRAQTAEVTFHRAIGARTAVADVDLLRRVLENLLDNAIRHAPRGSQVRLTTTGSATGVELRIADAGTGIPPELRAKIFEPFVQLDSGERAVTRTGRGLGLAFCKLAVEAHGGKLWVEDAEVGAVFCLRLPNER
jgi:signal transduction histidine kinase